MTTKARKPPRKSLKRLREGVERRVLENLLVDDWGDHDLWQRLRVPNAQDTWLPIGTPSDRRKGGNWPLWRTEEELDRLRQLSRTLCASNDYAKCLLRNLTNHVIGKGFTYKAQSKEMVDVDPETPGEQEAPSLTELVKATQDVIDEFLEINRWNASTDPAEGSMPNGTREREAFRRVRRDGEAVVRFFFLEHGRTKVRFVEPEQIRQPPGGQESEGWSYGIQHNMMPFEDVEDIVQYHVVYQDSSTRDRKQTSVGELVPACQIVHIKNVDEDAAVKRGLPDFVFDTAEALQRASKLQRNVSINSQIRAATAEIWQYATATNAQLTSLAQGFKESETTNPRTGATTPVERIGPGTIRRIPAGQTMVPPPASTGTTEHLAAAQGDLRQASAGFCAPEYLTGDASNANYASTREAGTPFVRSGECDQEHFKGAYLVCVWKAVRHAVESGRLPKEVLTLVKIQVEAPTVTTRDELQQAQEDQILIPLGVKDRQTAMMERGLDPELVQANNDEWTDRNGSAAPPLPMPNDPSGGNPFAGLGESRYWRRVQRQLNRLREDWDEGKHKRAKGGKFGSGGGGSGSDVHADAGHTLEKPSLVAKMKALPGKVATAAKNFATNLYNKAEKKYGPRWAKAIVATAIITLPTPVTMGAVGAMTGLAHVWTKYVSKTQGQAKESLHEGAEGDMTDEQIQAAAESFIKDLLAGMPKEKDAKDAA